MDIQSLLSALISFINDAILPFLMAVAFLFFLWNVVRFFIIGAAQEDSRAKAKSLAIWGILAFVVITSIWGIVNLLQETLGVGSDPLTPDYMEDWCERQYDAGPPTAEVQERCGGLN